ncbi:MAG: hypothetical protein Q4F41_12250 [Eubacteriales bacterium]|nr:hypothetical protein [Eubacteriales bacterium]
MEKKKGLLRKCMVVLAMGMLMAMLCGMSASAATKTYSIKAGKLYANPNSGTTYHKITIKKAGYIGIQAYSVTSSGSKASIQIGLLNSSKKPLEKYYRNLSSSSGYVAYYGVKKGTYYIATKSNYGYRLKYAFGAITESSGSSKSSAKVISQGVTRNGTVPIGESGKKSDWYKIRIVNKSSFNLSVKTLTNGGDLVIQVQIPKWNLNKKYVCSSGDSWTRTYRITNQSGAATGSKITAMAYIRVYRKSNYSATSGAYSLKWT